MMLFPTLLLYAGNRYSYYASETLNSVILDWPRDDTKSPLEWIGPLSEVHGTSHTDRATSSLNHNMIYNFTVEGRLPATMAQESTKFILQFCRSDGGR